MRTQTTLGRIVGGADERMLGAALLFFRIAAGAWIFSLSMAFGSSLTVLGGACIGIGIAYVVGFLTRPAGSVLIALLLLCGIFLPAMLETGFFAGLMLAAVGLFGLAGGMGHAFGLNGIVLRNIRHPGALSRSLFG